MVNLRCGAVYIFGVHQRCDSSQLFFEITILLKAVCRQIIPLAARPNQSVAVIFHQERLHAVGKSTLLARSCAPKGRVVCVRTRFFRAGFGAFNVLTLSTEIFFPLSSMETRKSILVLHAQPQASLETC